MPQLDVPNWRDGPGEWDTVKLGGVTLPGVCKVSVSKAQKIDEKTAPGVHGATLTYQGYKPAVVTIVCTIWDPDDLPALTGAIQAIEPVPSKSLPSPADLVHPLAAIRNVNSVIVEEIEGPAQTQPGRFETTFKCIEYFPPKGGATTTPNKSTQPKQTSSVEPKFPGTVGDSVGDTLAALLK